MEIRKGESEMKRTKCKYLSILVIMYIVYAGPSLAQDKAQEITDQYFRKSETSVGTLPQLLQEISSAFRVPIGLEKSTLNFRSPEREIEVNLKQGNLQQTLDKVFEQNGNYRWRLTNGVINVFPKANRDPVLEDILDTQVEKFSLEPGVSRLSVRDAMLGLPEIKAKLTLANVTAVNVGTWHADFDEVKLASSIILEKVTLREILNHIAKECDYKFWVVERWGEQNEFVTLRF